MFETQQSRNKTSSGDIGLNIRTLASPKVGQDQVSGGVSPLSDLHVRFCTLFAGDVIIDSGSVHRTHIFLVEH